MPSFHVFLLCLIQTRRSYRLLEKTGRYEAGGPPLALIYSFVFFQRRDAAGFDYVDKSTSVDIARIRHSLERLRVVKAI